jgi:YVTN family beta-propeller protein
MGPTAGPIRNYHFASAALPQWAGEPAWLAYDHGVQTYYVAETPSLLVGIAAGTYTVAVTIGVGSSPFGVAYDPNDSRVFVTNTASANVTAVSDATNLTVGSVNVGASPLGIAFDNATDQIFVANSGSNTVSVISASTLKIVTNVSVGSGPTGVAYDPVSRNVFVANNGSDNVTTISTATDTVVANTAAGSGPYAVAVDNRSGNVFVTNAGSGNVTVLDPTGTLQVATIDVGSAPAGLTYDYRNGTVWVDQGRLGVVVINATTNTVVQAIIFDPQGATYNPDRNEICVTNSANNTFQCLVPNSGSAPTSIRFQESGLPNGTTWGVAVAGFRATSTTSTVVATLAGNWVYDYSVDVVSQYAATPSSGTFQSPYAGSLNITVGFSPSPGSYAVTFREIGLPLTGWSTWGVNISNVSYPSYLADFAVSETNGTHSYAPEAYYAFATPPPNSFVVAGADRTVVVNYLSPGYTMQFVESNLPGGIGWTVTFNGTRSTVTTVNGQSSSLYFYGIANGTYPYAIAPVPGWSSGYPASGSLSISGRDDYLGLAYFPNPGPTQYSVLFDESGLARATPWSITLNGTTQSGNGTALSFLERNGTYNFTVGPHPGYAVTPTGGIVAVEGSDFFVSIVFQTNTSGGAGQFSVVFQESGLAHGLLWTVDVDGSIRGSSGLQLTFAEPNGSHVYAVGPFLGYRATPDAAAFVVNGSSVLIAIDFATTAGPTLYTVGFAETGLTAGTSWSVDLGGVTRASSTTQLLFEEPNGSYSYLVFQGHGSSAPYGATLTVNGSAIVVPLSFPLPSAPNGTGTVSSGSAAPPWYVDAGLAAAVILGAVALVVTLLTRPPSRPRP